MPYYDALVSVWQTLPDGDTRDQKIAAVNAMTVPGPSQDVKPNSVVAYLATNGKLSGLLNYAKNPPATQAGVALKT